jgi:2-polyprenyl-6-methoxyphenol hydroxylase-like FAD-dependent oxidoreductase
MSYQRAIVVGSGMAGLVSSATLAPHFEQVVLIDRDAIAPDPADRRGVPQSYHFHGLLPGGLEVMMELFPGFDQDLLDAGSLTPEPTEFYAYTPEGKSYSIMRFQPEPQPAPPGFPRTHIQTRRLLERCLRTRVEAVPNVEVRYETMVRELVTDNGRAIGVRVDDTGEELTADLVIDATGRVSRTLGWLDQLGYERPQESHIHCNFAYTSAFFRPKNPDAFTDVGFFLGSDPEGPHPDRGGALVRAEQGLWLAMVAGRFGDHPPTDFEGYLAFAETLIEPRFHQLISAADLVEGPHHFKFPKSIRRHYERLEKFPDGLLPIGDAISHNNPVYGQGMSSAARQARALGQLVADRSANGRSLDGLWRDYFPRVFQETRAPWLFAAMADFSRPKCTGDFPSEEQPTIELLTAAGNLAEAGDGEAAMLVASIGALREPLSTLEAPAWQERLRTA